jgi:pimeloyl-ACP methyl ester carboxylesterase
MIVTAFPRPVRCIEHTLIPLRDGTNLAARIWLPEDAEQNKVPAILEYLPYRKRDGTYERDALTHPYLAGHGYAGVRVDIRGSGESDGLLADEYARQEQDDAMEVIAWLAAQPWCTGSVGMMGISWGGFNALQVAARQPPALKAIVTICSTDDRYRDDVHYMGGALLTAKFGWAAFFFSAMCHPPDPALVGDRWKSMWLERLRNVPMFLETWLRHQRRDAYWRHGSVCEDYGAIACPVYAVGGWTDGYTNAIPRLLEHLTVPRKGLIRTATVTIFGGTLDLPVRTSSAADTLLPPLPDPETAAPEQTTVIRPGVVRIDRLNLELGTQGNFAFYVDDGKPLSAVAEMHRTESIARDLWQVRIEIRMRLSCTRDAFLLWATMQAWNAEDSVCHREWDVAIQRDHV